MAKLIMVVNDRQEILELFQVLLTGAGYEVSLHIYGKREIEEVMAIGPDLIILDFPPLDREQYSWQFLHMLKMVPATAQIPVVVCTTTLRAIQDKQAWMISHGIRVVAMPFNPDDLIEAINSLIGDAEQPGPGLAAMATADLAEPRRGTTDQDGESS